LKSNPLFEAIKLNVFSKAKLGELVWQEFCDKLTVRRLAKNQPFLEQGEYAREIAFVNKGLILSYTIDNKGNERVIQMAFEKYWTTDLFSFYSEKQAAFTLKAQEDTTLLVMSKKDLNQLCEKYPSVEHFFRLLAEEAYVYSLQRIINIYGENAGERYAALLKDQPDLNQRVKQQDIASYLGIEAPSLSRILKQDKT